jgi:signal transduction histidine kinase/PAS domain-containing protein
MRPASSGTVDLGGGADCVDLGGGADCVDLGQSALSPVAADRLAALAAEAAEAPAGLVQLVDGARLRVLGGCGLPADWQALRDVPLDNTVAGLVVRGGFPIVVEDTRSDGRVPVDAPIHAVGARAYAGFPIRDPQGAVVGVCCVLDYRPRSWRARHLAAVDHAAQVCTAFVTEELARREADRQRRFLDALVESLRVGVIACDADGRVALMNAELRAVHGDPPPDLDPDEWAALAGVRHPDGRPMPARETPLARAMRGERLCDVELLVVRPDAPRRLLAVNAVPILGADGERIGAVAVSHEVTAVRRAERFRSCELAVATALADAGSAEEAGPRALAAIAATIGWQHAELWFAGAATGASTGVAGHAARATAGELRPAARWSAPEVSAPTVLGRALAGRVWESGEPLWVTDVGGPGSPVPAGAAAGLRTALAMPVRSGTRVLGVLAVFAAAVEDPEAGLVALLSGVAAHVGQFLERRRAEDLQLLLARSKDEYLGLVGHELRTPLTSVSAYTDVLREMDPATLAAEGPALLEIVGRNAASLRRVVDQLIDLVALDAGQAPLSRAPADLAALVRDALAAAGPELAAAGLALHAELPDALALPGDPRRLRQLVDALLDNAVRYSPAGGRLDVVLRADGDCADLLVADPGIGVPEAERDRIFARFFRGEQARRLGIPGTGLGLAISRAIVERHGGAVAVLPDPGPGTRVQVRLPLAAGPC